VASRQSAAAKRHPRSAKLKYQQRVTSLLSRRDELIEGILVCHRARGPSPFLAKADALLTRFWARADWKEREEILRAARWLLDMGSGQAAVPQGAPPKNGRRRANASGKRPLVQAGAGAVDRA